MMSSHYVRMPNGEEMPIQEVSAHPRSHRIAQVQNTVNSSLGVSLGPASYLWAAAPLNILQPSILVNHYQAWPTTSFRYELISPLTRSEAHRFLYFRLQPSYLPCVIARPAIVHYALKYPQLSQPTPSCIPANSLLLQVSCLRCPKSYSWTVIWATADPSHSRSLHKCRTLDPNNPSSITSLSQPLQGQSSVKLNPFLVSKYSHLLPQ